MVSVQQGCNLFEEQPTRIRFVSVVGALVVARSPRGVTVPPQRLSTHYPVCALYGADSCLKKDDILEVN